jgi:hypothetical protein
MASILLVTADFYWILVTVTDLHGCVADHHLGGMHSIQQDRLPSPESYLSPLSQTSAFLDQFIGGLPQISRASSCWMLRRRFTRPRFAKRE